MKNKSLFEITQQNKEVFQKFIDVISRKSLKIAFIQIQAQKRIV